MGGKRDKIRILYLRDKQDYISRTYRYFYDEIEAASHHPLLDVYLWGPGWKNYNDSITLQDNIAATFAKNYFHIVYTSANTPPPLYLESSVFVYSLGDCHEHRCVKEIKPTMDVLAFRYAFEPMDYFRYEQIQEIKRDPEFINIMPETTKNWFPLMYHSSECSLERIFYPSTPRFLNEGWADSRPFDVRLFGQAKVS